MKCTSGRKLIGFIGGVLGVLLLIPGVSAGSHKDFPEKNSDIYMPVSLAVGTVRTPEFSVGGQLYDIIVQVEKPLPFEQMECMMGVTSGPLESRYCSNNDPLLRADWTVWNNGHVVSSGSNASMADDKQTKKYIFKLLGSFAGEAGKKYVVEVRFTKDGTPLNVANPHLVVIQHRKFW
jgi:hypothetical protein